MFRCGIALLLAGSGIPSCFFDADIPLRNDAPEFVDAEEVSRVLYYPESTICTLTVADRNDTIFSVSTLPCVVSDDDSSSCATASTADWPGSLIYLSGGYDEKRIVMKWASDSMGTFLGTLLLSDADGAVASVPYRIKRTFIDAFDGTMLSDCWTSYTPDDSTRMGFDYVDGKLVFRFNHKDAPASGRQTAGVVSRFSLPGDFYLSVDFRLRDEMDDAFEVGFFVSTSSDTGRWDGDKAGVFITGTGGRLRFECRSVDLQSYSFETTQTGGELGISRTGSTISYYFHDGNPSVVPQPLVFQAFPADTGVVAHLRMTVDDVSKDRNCSWNDFCVTEGKIRFPEF